MRRINLDSQEVIAVCSRTDSVERACKKLHVGSNRLNKELEQLECDGLLTRRKNMPLATPLQQTGEIQWQAVLDMTLTNYTEEGKQDKDSDKRTACILFKDCNRYVEEAGGIFFVPSAWKGKGRNIDTGIRPDGEIVMELLKAGYHVLSAPKWWHEECVVKVTPGDRIL